MLASQRLTSGVATIALGLGMLSLPSVAVAEETAPQEEASTLEVMGEYSPSDFMAEAAELPVELVDAIVRDLGIDPEQYLAESAAAVQAVEVVESLGDLGVEVVDARMEGTDLVVNVATPEEAAVVESVGAIPDLGAPAPELDLSDYTISPAADVYDGQGWVWTNTQYVYQCSVGFTGYQTSNGAKQFATAGHCVDDMVGNASLWVQSAPGQVGSPGATLGTRVGNTPDVWQFGGGYDLGRISTGSNTQKASALTWGGARGGPLSSTPRAVTGDTAPIVGASLCKSGSRTGWSCGPIEAVDQLVRVGDPNTGPQVRSIIAQVCVLPGDSGGTGLVGTKGVGITSWTTANTRPDGPNVGRNYCADTGLVYAGFFQLVSPGNHESVAKKWGTTWELAATVSTPVITSISKSGNNDTAINGTVANAGRNYSVDVFIDGSSTPFATVSATSGSWSVSLASAPSGLHTFTAVARYGTWSKSSAATGSYKRGVTVGRIDGADRFAVGVKIAKEAYPAGGAPVVYVTTGLNYPDALSAAPAAAIQNGVLLLTYPNELPPAVRAEIIDLNPAKIVVVGGPNSVSTAVMNELKSIQSNTVRWSGADRFEASRTIVRNAFLSKHPSTAYIATGFNFPDALSASAAGGAFGYPVILVPGNAASVDAATLDLLRDLGVTEIKIAGGPNSVSNGILNSLKVIDPTPTRLSGADRFEASINIALDAFGSASASSTYIATGYNFPDALAGAPLAGSKDAPLLVVPTNCVPTGALQAMSQFATTKVTLLGGTASLTPDVQALKPC